jgi:hypothetical protein
VDVRGRRGDDEIERRLPHAEPGGSLSRLPSARTR